MPPRGFSGRTIAVVGPSGGAEEKLQAFGSTIDLSDLSNRTAECVVTTAEYFQEHQDDVRLVNALANQIPVVMATWVDYCAEQGMFVRPSRDFRLDVEMHDRTGFHVTTSPLMPPPAAAAAKTPSPAKLPDKGKFHFSYGSPEEQKARSPPGFPPSPAQNPAAPNPPVHADPASTTTMKQRGERPQAVPNRGGINQPRGGFNQARGGGGGFNQARGGGGGFNQGRGGFNQPQGRLQPTARHVQPTTKRLQSTAGWVQSTAGWVHSTARRDYSTGRVQSTAGRVQSTRLWPASRRRGQLIS